MTSQLSAGLRAWLWPVLAALAVGGSPGCDRGRQDGVTRLPFGEDVALALGRQRLLLPLDRRRPYRVTLRPRPGDAALLRASLCALDAHQRIDEGDSHCVGEEVVVDSTGSSAVELPAGEQRFGHLALEIDAQGPSAGPVTLRVEPGPP